MKTVFAVAVAIAIAVVIGVLVLSRDTTHTQIGPYDTPVFSVQFPTGAHVEPHDDPDKTDEGDSTVSHFYDGHMPGRGWANVSYTDFPSARKKDIATLQTEGSSALFRPGYQSSPMTDTTLGGLPGKELVVRGLTLDGGYPIIVRSRMAFSPDSMRLWALQTSFDDDRKGLSEADCENFFDSLKIK